MSYIEKMCFVNWRFRNFVHILDERDHLSSNLWHYGSPITTHLQSPLCTNTSLWPLHLHQPIRRAMNHINAYLVDKPYPASFPVKRS